MKNSANSSNVEGMSKVGYFENPASGNFNTWRMQRNSRVTPAKVNNAKPCRFCGNIEMSKQKRLAWGKQCQTCNSRNQLARVCKKSDRAHQVDVGETDTDSDTTMSLEAEHASRYSKETFTKMIDGDEITFQIDCGASVNIILLKYVERHGIKPSKKTLRIWNGENVTLVGSTHVMISNPKNQKRYSIKYAQEGFTLL